MEHILSLSYGKDSLACLGAIEELGLPLDRIIHAEVWATDTIPADLPPMVEFKEYADKVILERYGIDVEHFRSDKNYIDVFYRIYENSKNPEKNGKIYGFPFTPYGHWCTGELKIEAMRMAGKSSGDHLRYIGIAADESARIERAKAKGQILPLVELGWTEADCRAWCEENDLLSPIYTTTTRGGCWFCHNQGVDQLRILRKTYPEYWALMLKWDLDSPVPFHADGHTVHDFDRRFALEDAELIPMDRQFRWEWLENPPGTQMRLF